MKEILKKYGAYFVAAAIFLILAFTYCFPVLRGEVIYAGDNINAAAAVQEAVEYTEATGEHSWWTGSMFCGMPNYQIGGGEYKSEKLLAPLTGIFHRGHSHPAWILIIYFVCFFILLRSFGIDKWLSITGAVAIALSSYFLVIIAAGHNGKTSTIAIMSVVMAGMYLIFRRKYALGISFAMVFTAMGFGSHPQMAYYLFMMTGLLWFAELWIHIREKRMKDFAVATLLFFLSVGIGLGTGSAKVFSNSEYASETIRGGSSDLSSNKDESASSNVDNGLDIAYATQWSYGIDETMSFLIPGFMGGSSSYDVGRDSKLFELLRRNGVDQRSAAGFCSGVPMYWGEQPFTAGNVYMGAIICFLFVLGLIVVKGPYKWALLAATLFSTALAWGHNCMWLTEFFFKNFPLYNKFRAVSSILIVAEIAMPLLGFMAIKEIMDGKVDRNSVRSSILTAGGITAGICLVFALFGGSICSCVSSYDAAFAGQIPDWLYKGIIDERRSLLRSDSLRSAIFITAAVIVLLIFSKGRMKNVWLAAILGVLVVADLWPVDKRYFNDGNFVPARQNDNAFAMQEYEAAILQDSDPHFRVMNLTTSTFNDARTSYYLKSLGGYCAAKLRRYQDIIDVHLSKMSMPVIGMLNAKYIIVSEEGKAVPKINPYALGNAWYVGDIKVVDSADEEISSLSEIDLSSCAVTDKEFESMVGDLHPGISEDACVELTSYTPESLDYKCSSSQDGTIVFSEIYYPYGWKAFVDGKQTPHFRVNYLLRAINVSAGSHEIHFEFDPDSIRKGETMAIACILAMYAIVLCFIIQAVTRRRKEKA